MRAKRSKGKRSVALTLWFVLRKFLVIDGQNTRDQITSDRWSKRAWSDNE